MNFNAFRHVGVVCILLAALVMMLANAALAPTQAATETTFTAAFGKKTTTTTATTTTTTKTTTSAAAPTSTTPTTTSTPIPDDPFRSWLHNITIELPDFSKVVDGFNISVTGWKCSHFDFYDIGSQYQPPLTMNFNMTGLALTCHGTWGYFLVLDPVDVHHSGSIYVVVDSTNLSGGLQFTEDPVLPLALNATLLNFNLSAHISNISLAGGVVEEIIDFFFKSSYFLDKFVNALDGALDGVLTNLINVKLTKALFNIHEHLKDYVVPVQPDPAPPVPSDTFDLTNNSLIKLLDHVLDEQVGPSGINAIIDVLTNGTGVISRHNLQHLLVPPISLPSLGTIHFGISDFVVVGLDSWSDFDLFVPEDNVTLGTSTAMDLLAVNITFFINVTEAGDIHGSGLSEKAQLSMVLVNNTLKMRTQLALSNNVYHSLHGSQFLNLGCLCSVIEDVNFTEFLLKTSVQQLSLLADDGVFEKDLDNAINNLLHLFISSFGPAIPAFLNGYISGPLRQYINAELASVISSQSQHCGSPAGPDEIDSLTVVVPFTGCFVAFVLWCSIAMCCSRRRRSDEEKPLLREVHDPPLLFHPGIGCVYRYGVVFLTWGCISLFIFSNTNVGAGVYLLLSTPESSIRLPDLFEFGLANSVHDMWNAGVYPLSLMIAVFSGAWPYLKLLIVLVCWSFPVTVLSCKRREWLLMVIDALGKWSLIDSFVMVLMLVAFRFHVGAAAGAGGSSVDVYVEPGVGIYTFVGATMLSLLISHVALYFHRRMKPNYKVLSYSLDDKDALRSHHFKLGGRMARCTRLGQVLLPLLVLFAAGSLAAGAAIDSFEFVFKGAASFALTADHQSPSTSYSIISLGMQMPFSSPNPNSFGVRFLQVTYFMFALGVPMAHLLSILILWVTPLTLRAQHRLFVLAEVFYAWAAIDVFVVVIIAALLEIRQFAAFIVGDR